MILMLRSAQNLNNEWVLEQNHACFMVSVLDTPCRLIYSHERPLFMIFRINLIGGLY